MAISMIDEDAIELSSFLLYNKYRVDVPVNTWYPVAFSMLLE